MYAPVNKMIPLSVVDGIGNRTAIFLQKCNIACAYCHNPETQQICNSCGICVKECPKGALSLKGVVKWDSEKCVQCDHCIQVCPNNSSPKIQYVTPEEVIEQVKKNIPFIRGITVSGGECMLYPRFLCSLFDGVRKLGLSCYIDSNGTIDFSEHKELLELTDKVMLDVKAWDLDVYRKLTGGTNEIVKKNLKYLAERNKLEEVRIVCQETMVDVERVICETAKTVSENKNTFTLKLIRFRNHGVKGVLKEADSPAMKQMLHWEKIAKQQGFLNITIV
jgi:pyruvate formate lyase activating enzyme